MSASLVGSEMCIRDSIWCENQPWSALQSRSRATRAIARCRRDGVMRCHGVLGVPVELSLIHI
eukprot:780247-Alexandrium_andersonii.AAC.1